MFLCCTRKQQELSKKEESEEIIIGSDNEDDFEMNNRWKAFQYSIGDLKKAEREAFEIVERAKKNRKEYLKNAEGAATEIVRPYYDLAIDEFKEIEDSLNRELHIKSLENVLVMQEERIKNQEEQREQGRRKEEAVSYVLSKICDVRLAVENPKYLKSILEKHRVNGRNHRKKRFGIKDRVASWKSRSYSKQNSEKEVGPKKKVVSFELEGRKSSSMSTIELDEDYSRIDNMYGASRVVNSFNTIHLN
ncbi:Vacuolar (H+)-ATPase G subunit family protein [Cryptosporidium felis]|nr:Vacuolar (H+)-ATPase G subunit family protein [Cryptosporidium felis]